VKNILVKAFLLFLCCTLFLANDPNAFCQQIGKNSNAINLKQMKRMGSVDNRFESYNIEMCEVIGGDFWVPYQLLDSVL
jgi:hypothetical protein